MYAVQSQKYLLTCKAKRQYPANTKHLYNIYITLAQRLRWFYTAVSYPTTLSTLSTDGSVQSAGRRYFMDPRTVFFLADPSDPDFWSNDRERRGPCAAVSPENIQTVPNLVRLMSPVLNRPWSYASHHKLIACSSPSLPACPWQK